MNQSVPLALILTGSILLALPLLHALFANISFSVLTGEFYTYGCMFIGIYNINMGYRSFQPTC